MTPDAPRTGALDAYYLFDGDLVGRRIDELLITSSDENVRAFSNRLGAAISSLVGALEEAGCSVVYAGGDSILAQGVLSDSEIQALQDEFHLQAGVTISVGMGRSKAACILALKVAKARGTGYFQADGPK